MDQETLEAIRLPAAAVSKCFIACPASSESVPSLWGTPIILDDASADVGTDSECISLCYHLLHRAHHQLEAAFSRSRGQSPARLQATVICSPHPDLTEAVDAAVVFLAHQLRADVVILDPADLAAGGEGVLGPEFTAALWEDLKTPGDSVSDRDGPSRASCIEGFVRMRLDSVEPSKRRLLYLRDFGALVNTALISEIAACASQSPDVLVVAGTAPFHAAPSKFSSASPALSAEHTRYMHGLDYGSLTYIQKVYAMSLRDADRISDEFRCMEDLYTALFAVRYLGDMLTNADARDEEDSSDEDGLPLKAEMHALGILLRKPPAKKPDTIHMPLTSQDRKAIQKANMDITTVVRVALARELPPALRDRYETARRLRLIRTNLCMLGWSLSPLGKSLKDPLNDEQWKGILKGEPNFLDGIGVRVHSKEEREAIAEMLPVTATVHDIVPALQSLARGKVEWRQQVKLGTEKWFYDPLVEQVKADSQLSEEERGLLNCIVDPTSVTTTFADVHIPEPIIDALRTVVTLPLVAPSAYSKGILSSERGAGVLLYGPPGTGKTMACRALVQESRIRMLQVQASTIMRSHVGESEAIVTAIFSLARRLGPCIIFIDELDAIFGARNSLTPVWHTTVLTEFMQEMDGLRTADTNRRKGVIVVGATNRPQDLDYAIIRRLPRRILVDLPGINERQSILKHYLRDEECDISVDLKMLAVKTPLFSGSDLRDLVLAATLNAVKSGLPDGWQINRGITDPLQDTPRTLRPKHFSQALKEISASCATDMSGLEKVRQWSKTGRTGVADESGARTQQHRVNPAIPIPHMQGR